MATKHQIMLVKTIHRRLKELLGDNKVTVTVSYTSASDMLRITFKKVLKGAAFELPICSSLKEYTLHPEILQYIVTDALDKMPKPPKWNNIPVLLAELGRRYSNFTDYCRPMPVRSRNASVFGAGFTSLQDATIAYYSLCGGETARSYDFSSSDLDLFESSFERDAGLASGGEYTRWREAGEPKRWTDPTEVRHVVPGRPDIDIRSVAVQYSPRETAAANNWSPVPIPDPTNWHRIFNTACPVGMSVNNQAMRYYTVDSLGGSLLNADQLDALRDARRPTYFAGQPVDIPAPLPNTLFGLPVIWADELPPTQGSTNEQA